MLDFLQAVPANARKWVYAIIGLLAFAVGIWRASDGNWLEFVFGLIVSANNTLAAKNVRPEPNGQHSTGSSSPN